MRARQSAGPCYLNQPEHLSVRFSVSGFLVSGFLVSGSARPVIVESGLWQRASGRQPEETPSDGEKSPVERAVQVGAYPHVRPIHEF